MALTMKVTGLKEFKIRVRNTKKILPVHMATAINRSLVKVGGQVEYHLQNRYLHVRSADLSGSFVIRPVASAKRLTATLGSRIRYASVHNTGFRKTVNVRAHTRRGAPVRAHSMRMNVKATHYFDDAVKKKRVEIEKEFENAVRKSVK